MYYRLSATLVLQNIIVPVHYCAVVEKAKETNFLELLSTFFAVLWIRIRRFCVFGPPGSGSVIICTDPDPSINKAKQEKQLIFTIKVISKKLIKKIFFVSILSARQKNQDTDLEPDPYQNVTDLQHCFLNR